MFKIGDKVRIHKRNTMESSYILSNLGRIGFITEFHHEQSTYDEPRPYATVHFGENTQPLKFYLRDLEIVESAIEVFDNSVQRWLCSKEVM